MKSLLSVACAKNDNVDSEMKTGDSGVSSRLSSLGERAMLELGNLLCSNKEAQDTLLVTDLVIPLKANKRIEKMSSHRSVASHFCFRWL